MTLVFKLESGQSYQMSVSVVVEMKVRRKSREEVGEAIASSSRGETLFWTSQDHLDEEPLQVMSAIKAFDVELKSHDGVFKLSRDSEASPRLPANDTMNDTLLESQSHIEPTMELALVIDCEADSQQMS